MSQATTLRHLLATLAYRLRQIFREVPEDYPDFNAGHGVRTPVEILCHMSAVLNYACHCFEPVENLGLETLSWNQEKTRFTAVCKRLDAYLATGQEPQKESLNILLQGPLSDAMTHVGQLATLRRLAGQPVPGESFIKASIEIGHLSLD